MLGFVQDHVVFNLNLFENEEVVSWTLRLKDVVYLDMTLHFLLIGFYSLFLGLLLGNVREI